jgi:hypothetical protein
VAVEWYREVGLAFAEGGFDGGPQVGADGARRGFAAD